MDGMENASGLGVWKGMYPVYSRIWWHVLWFFLGEKLSLQISSIILSENMLNCCYFTYVHSIKIMSFWSTTDGDANNVGPPLPGPALRTSAGSSTNLHMLSTILGADLQENFLREITYFTKGISQHSQLKKRTLTGTRPSNMSPSGSIQGRGLRSVLVSLVDLAIPEVARRSQCSQDVRATVSPGNSVPGNSEYHQHVFRDVWPHALWCTVSPISRGSTRRMESLESAGCLAN